MWQLRNVSNFIQTGCEMEESLVAWPGYVTDIPESRTFGKFLVRDGMQCCTIESCASSDNDHFSSRFRSRINKVQRQLFLASRLSRNGPLLYRQLLPIYRKDMGIQKTIRVSILIV